MSLRGWLKTLDNLTPRCRRCNRKIRNAFKCRTCGALLCSESCVEKHFNLVHAPQVMKQQADAVVAELRKHEQQKKMELDAAAAKRKQQERLRTEIERATERLEQYLDAWREAGSPDVERADVDRAKEEASSRRTVVRQAGWQRSLTSVNLSYLKLARFTRKVSGRLNQPWFVPSMIGGAVFFTLALLLALPLLLIAKSLVLVLALAGIGLLGGFLAMACLLLLPSDNELGESIAVLEQQKSDQLEPLDAATRASEKARQRYENLAHLYQLRTACERAALEKRRLQEEYQAVCPGAPVDALPALAPREPSARASQRGRRPAKELESLDDQLPGPRYPARASWGIPLMAGAVALPAVLFILCCGGFSVMSLWGLRQEAQEIAQADKLYAEGKQEEAVGLYKQHPSYLLDPDGKGLDALRRIVEFEVAKGHTNEARTWTERALDKKLQVTFDNEAAKQLLDTVQQERARVAARNQQPDGPAPDQGLPPPEEEPIPSLARPGTTGAAAYDLYPEPWRTQFVADWQHRVGAAKRDVDTALAKWQAELADAKKDLAEEEEHLRRMEAQGIRSGRDKQLQAAKDRVALLEKAGAEQVAKDAKARLQELQTNDPPYFASQKDKEDAEFAALPPAEQERRKELRRRWAEWLGNQNGAAQQGRLVDAGAYLRAARRQLWAGGLQQIPATVIDKGVLRYVPYQSFRAGDYELNVYGDPDRPAGLEIGLHEGLLRSAPAKAGCVEFMAAVLNVPADRAVLKSLKTTQDTKERAGLTFEVTPETADDAYGGWWVSVYDKAALDQARASPPELARITVPKEAPQTSDTGPVWTPAQQALSRPGANSVYVQGYVRKNGTYVQGHMRAAPGSGGHHR
jgi:hypothetical protein